MKLGKILMGAAIGVGAVAAAPFTGGGSIIAGVTAASSLAGAATVAGAVGAAGAGAVIAAAVDEMNEDEERERRMAAKESGFVDGMKKGEMDTKEKLMPILKDIESRNNYILALTAFGYSVANCDGEIAPEEVDELDYYLNYIQKDGTLPDEIKMELTIIQRRKDNFQNIKKYIDEVDVEYLGVFEEVLENIIMADGIEMDEEKEFRKEWQVYYEQRKN